MFELHLLDYRHCFLLALRSNPRVHEFCHEPHCLDAVLAGESRGNHIED